MMVRNAGEGFCMSDERILEINSPRPDPNDPNKPSVTGGPYVVVHKNPDERWAIVAFDWEGGPNLGFRWFYGNHGHPQTVGTARWEVIPTLLSQVLLNGLAAQGLLSDERRKKVEAFLAGPGKLSGKQLKASWPAMDA